MAEVKWIKIATNIFDNKKIRMIESMPEGDSIIVIWFKILMLAGTVNDLGNVYFTKDIPYTDQMLSTLFGRPLSIVQLALSTFVRFEMIEIINDVIHVSNWEKYQNIEGLERVREQTRLRVSKYREAKRLECNVTSNVTVTDSNGTDIDKEVDKEKEKRVRQFTPPSLDEVKAYCLERGNKIDAKAFFDYYEAGGWKDSKGNPVKNWKQKCITWENHKAKPKENKFNQMIHSDYDFEAIEKEILK